MKYGKDYNYDWANVKKILEMKAGDALAKGMAIKIYEDESEEIFGKSISRAMPGKCILENDDKPGEITPTIPRHLGELGYSNRVGTEKGKKYVLIWKPHYKKIGKSTDGERKEALESSKKKEFFKNETSERYYKREQEVNFVRIKAIADVFASLEWEGIIKFDLKEPEYLCFYKLKPKADFTHLCLIAICAGIIDYQLAGDAYLFWRTLRDVASKYDKFQDIDTVKQIIYKFLDCSVNARLNSQKRYCLDRIFSSSFPQKIIGDSEFLRQKPYLLWQQLSEVTNRKMDMKTVVMAMKVFDLVHLLYYENYANFPEDIPIPVDIHIKRMSYISGIVEDEEISNNIIRFAWGKVCKRVSNTLDKTITSFRIDSSVWQIGKLASQSNWRLETVLDYLNHEIQINKDKAEKLAKEFLWRRLIKRG